ncbi:MAG: ChbG/HpnK family deacetylase [Hyphomicrobium sp.]|uniref:ChbG/HpnK family deacetylase n=1 Tax=Hyphomicrobium sp. TaxID=82 RepID=UPI003D0CB535
MLIVNADDLGRSIAATDPVMSCHGKGRISSASAMVFMADSERAARLSRDAALDVGLHVNFSEEFSAASVSKSVREAHDKVRRFLKAGKYALLLFNPALTREFELVFAAQIEEFQRLYGRPPSHLDGHQHLHLATNVLVQKLMPEGAKVRRSFSFRPGEKGVVNRSYRSLVDRSLARRHRLTDYFFSLTDYMTPERLTRLAALAGEADVELMVHPERPGELAFLMSDAYAEALSGVRLAGYEAL